MEFSICYHQCLCGVKCNDKLGVSRNVICTICAHIRLVFEKIIIEIGFGSNHQYVLKQYLYTI